MNAYNEQQARRLLAAESEDCLKWGILNLPMEKLRHDLQAPLRAIVAALAAQPAAAQEAVGWQWRWLDTYGGWSEWTDGGSRKEIDARIARWKADGEDHRMQVRPVFAAPVTAAPVDLDALAVNRYRPVPDGLLAYKVVAGDGTRSLFSGTMNECNVVARKLTEAFLDGAHVASTPAAPGIDLYPIRCALQYAAAAARENTHTEMAEGFDALIRKIDASPKTFQPTRTYSLDILGNPMRQYEPGKWESARWPSDASPKGDDRPRSDLVPGVMRCAKCAFQLHRTNLYIGSGTIGPGDSKTEPCPNGCGPLWPVTWQMWATEGWQQAERYHDELRQLQDSPKGGSEARDAALNTLAIMFHNSEEIEGPDGMAVSIDLALWHEALEAYEVLIGDYDEVTLATSAQAQAGDAEVQP